MDRLRRPIAVAVLVGMAEGLLGCPALLSDNFQVASDAGMNAPDSAEAATSDAGSPLEAAAPGAPLIAAYCEAV